MTRIQLTERQKEVYDLIQSLITQRGYGPTVREIGENFGIKSPNGVMCHLRALERKGLITRKANKSRAIELTDENARSVTGIPLLGVVSKHPLPLDPQTTDAIDLGKTLATGRRYVVQVSGDDFRDRGLLDGDFLILERDASPMTGQLVLCKVSGDQAVLQPWNGKHLPVDHSSSTEEQPIDHDPTPMQNGRSSESESVLGSVVSMVRLVI